MEIELTPERKFARLVVRKYSLRPPIDIEALVSTYAQLSFMRIPFRDVDGISLNLKSPGKTTHVIVNEAAPRSRRRFTMAHEMGHIVIPWHVGAVIIDRVDVGDSGPGNWLGESWIMEQEANSFAAELLMPYRWIEQTISVTRSLAEAHKRVLHECQVSALAAAIRLSDFLPESIVYASEMDGRVEFSGRTEGTIASPLEGDTRFPSDPFDYSEHHSVATVQGRKLHWWKLPRAIRVDTKDARPWREILDGILHDIFDSDQAIVKHRKSINGVIGYAFSQCGDKSNVDSVTSACVQRLGDRPAYDALVRHDSFSGFIRKRAEDLASGGRR